MQHSIRLFLTQTQPNNPSFSMAIRKMFNFIRQISNPILNDTGDNTTNCLHSYNLHFFIFLITNAILSATYQSKLSNYI